MSIESNAMANAATGKHHMGVGKKLAAAVAVLSISVATMMFMLAAPGFGDTAWTQKADPSTSTPPTSTTISTRDVGQVWTDKTVVVDSSNNNFDVTLSALSSAGSNTVNQQQPLDIVLIVDVSGSMDEASAYYYADQLDTSRTYIIHPYNNGYDYYTTYHEAGTTMTTNAYGTISITQDGWYTNYYGTRVIPKTGPDDTATNHYDFWTSKLGALQTAVDGFINSTNALNAGITDPDKVNRVALVKFAYQESTVIGDDGFSLGGTYYNYTQVVSDFTTNLTGSGGLTEKVDALQAGGPTRSDFAFDYAQKVMSGTDLSSSTPLTGARSDAKRVVIFFTDGVPTTQNTFSTTVANSAVATSGKMKKDDPTVSWDGVEVYSIGTFDGVDPTHHDTSATSDEERANTFLNAVSSNYPNATAWNMLGTRVSEDEQYFYGDSNAGELTHIHDDIFSHITTSSGYPVSIGVGEDANSSGYVTFSDTLGSYMEVKTMGNLVYTDKTGHTYTVSPTSSSTDGNTTTYTYNQAVSTAIAGDTNLNKIIVSVTSNGDASAAGDTVTLQVPAGLMPLEFYDLQTDVSGNTTLSRNTPNPLQLNYEVGLKDTYKTYVDNQDFSHFNDTYLNNNTDTNGNLHFYANAFTQGDVNGEASASFSPSTTNRYYYFTSDTPLYANNSGTPATSASSTYYYQVTNWTASTNGGVATSNTEYIQLPEDAVSQLNAAGDIIQKDGRYYVKSGSVHYENLTTTPKSPNTSTTATNSSALSMSAGVVTNSLGNNGDLYTPRPGKLAITKYVELPAGAADHSSDTFTFNITVNGATGSHPVHVVDESGLPVSDAPTSLTFTNGSASCTLKAGQTITIDNLQSGSSYTVTESNLPAGYENTTKSGDTGTINANNTSTATFTNTYSMEPIEPTVPTQIVKILNGRNFKTDPQDTFTFVINPSYSGPANITNPPLPSGVTPIPNTKGGQVTISPNDSSTNTYTFSGLGTIKFEAPGTYTYAITETVGSIHGISYSRAQYTLTVKIKDDGNGNLVVESGPTLVQNYDDDGVDTGTNATAATFTNTYNADSISTPLLAAKIYRSSTGDDTLGEGQFLVRLKPTGSNAADAPMPVGTTGSGADRVYYTRNDAGGKFDLGSLQLTQQLLGSNSSVTFAYEVTELIDDPRTSEVETADPHITYDSGTHTISVTLTRDQSTGELSSTVVYTDNGTTVTNGNRISNTYAATSVNKQLEGSKALVGRDMQEGETFEFTLTPDTATQTAIANGELVMPASTTKTVFGGANGQAVQFAFDEIEFKHEGTYRFYIEETAGNKGGVTYDSHRCTAVVTVTDNDGQLVATVNYGTSQGNPANQFRNTYTAQMTYPGVNIAKTLTGHALAENQFGYTINGVNSGTVTADQANAKLSTTDRAFTNPNAADDGVQSIWTKLTGISFDQTDIGKTYSYRVVEVNDGKSGYTYDSTVYTVAITVLDNGDGTLKTSTTVTNGDGSYSQTVENVSQAATGGNEDAPATSQTLALVPFANSYSATGTLDGSTNLRVKKNLTGREWVNGDSFSYTIEPTGIVTVDAVNAGDVILPTTWLSITNTTSGYEAAFGNITFKKAGVYQFVVKETLPEDDDADTAGVQSKGSEYDQTEKLVIVTVTDNGNGTLTCTKSADSDPLSFTNTYQAKPTTASWNGRKTLENRDFKTGDEFTFQISGSYSGSATNVDIPMPAVLENVTTEGGVKTGTWTWRFSDYGTSNPTYIDARNFQMLSGDLSFTAPGTYSYEIAEVTGSLPGITYSHAHYRCTVVVTDDGQGQLHAAASLTKLNNDDGSPANSQQTGEALFTNSAASDITISLRGAKAYVDTTGGNALQNGMFTFTLKPDTAYSDAATIPMPAGSTGGQTGTNRTYTTTNQGEIVSLGSIKLTQDDVGNTYHYIAQETIPSGATGPDANGFYKYNGMTYDGRIHRVAVTVTQDTSAEGNPISAAITWTVDGNQGSAQAFVNRYEPNPASAQIGGSKTLNGRAMLSGESFGFTLTPANDTTRAAVTNGEITLANTSTSVSGAGDGVETNFSFGNASFKKVGIYTFTMTETPGSAGGVTYDTHNSTVTVNVSDNGTGTLDATVSYDTYTPAGGNPRSSNKFINTYKPDNTSMPVTVTKVLTGRTPGLQAGEFTFNMSVTGPDGGWTIASPSGTTAGTATNQSNGTVNFGNIVFSKTGTYHVSVNEVIPNPQSTFMTYDDHTYSFDVVVTDNQQTGKLEATRSNETNSSRFTNTFHTPDDTKTVDEKDSSGNTQVQNADGEMVSVGDHLTYTVHWVNTALDSTGKPAAATVTVTDRIPEGTTFVSANNSGSYDATSRTITWTINANAEQQGDVSFDVQVDEGVFNLPHLTVENTATVTINGNPAQTNTVHNSVPKKTVMNNSTGADINNQAVTVGQVLKYRISYTNVTDSPVDITITDQLDTGLDFVAADGATYDESTRTITWNLNGVQARTSGYVEFTARVNENALDDKSVDNTGTVTIGNDSETTNTVHNTLATGSIGLSKNVQLHDPTSTQIDTTKEFTFTVTLVDASGNALTGRYPFTGTSDGDTQYAGTVASGETITLKSGGSVTISELPTGATWTIQETHEGGYTADQWTRTGTVPATGTVAASFANTYSVTENTIPLQVNKVLAGDRDPGLQEGEFTFHAMVTADEGSPSDGFYLSGGTSTLDKTNDADGTVNFGNIHFTKVGTYKVWVNEVIPADGAPFMTYDTHIYSFPVTVTDNGDGTLNIVKGTETGSSSFTNTYNPPDDIKTVTEHDGTATVDVNGQLVGVGDQLTYSITWTNDAVDSTGKSVAADITVTDVVPEGTKFISADNDGTESGGTVTWNLGEQAAGATGTVSFVVEITDDAVDLTDDDPTSTIVNEAKIKVGDHDPKTTNQVTNIVPEKDVSQTSGSTTITDADGNLVGVGDVLTYTVGWKNTNDTAADITVTDTLPEGTSYVSGSGAGDGTHTTAFTAPDASGNVKWVIRNVPAGESGTVTYQVKVEESIYDLATPTVENQATVQIGNNPGVETNTTENPLPEKDVSQTSGTTTITDADGNLVGLGDVLTYSITWENHTGSAADVTIADSVPGGTTFVGSSAKLESATDADGNNITPTTNITQPADGAMSGDVGWVLEDVPDGASGTVTFQVTVDKSAVDLADRTVKNTATVKIDGYPAVSTNTTKNPVPEKEVDNASGTDINNSQVKVGDVLTYTISYTNGETTASTVTITDVIPTGTAYVGDSATTGTGITLNAPADGGTGTVSWTISDVAAGASGTVTFKVKVTEDALTSGQIENTAEVKVGDDNPAVKTNPVDNTVKTGSIKISKTSSAVEGQTLPDATFKFKVTLYDTSGAQLTGSYSFTGTSDGSTAYSGTVSSGGTVTLKNNGDITITGLPEGASWTVEEIEVPAGFSPNPTVHQGTVPDNTAANSSFDNTYDTQNVELPIKLRKVLTGRDLVNGEFAFTMEVKNTTTGAAETDGWSLTPPTGTTAGTATNDAEGIIDFGVLKFTQPGTYTVTAKETEGTLPFVTYDTAERQFIVTITDVNPDTGAQDGILRYKLTDASGNDLTLSDIVFRNTYNPPDDTKTVSDTTLEITDADGRQVQIGDTLHYTVNWVNDALDENGSSGIATVTVTDTVPRGTKYTDGTAKAFDKDGNQITDGVTISGPDDSGTITWVLTDRAAGATGSVSFDVTVDKSVADNAYAIDNKATIQVGSDDPKQTNNTHNTVPEKDVSNVTHNVTDANGQLVGMGDTLTYTVHWRNDATDDTGNPTEATIKISDPLPGYTTYVVDSATGDSASYTANDAYTGDDHSVSKGTVNWEFTAAAGASGTVSFQVTVDEDAFNSNGVDNQASITVGDHPAVKTNPTENLVPQKTVGSSHTNEDGTVVTIEDADGKTVGVGDTLTYHILYWNRTDEKADMLATDSVPAGTAYVDDSATAYKMVLDAEGNPTGEVTQIVHDDENQYTVSKDESGLITWSIKNVAPGEMGYAEFRVTVTDDAVKLANHTVENKATAKIGDSPEVWTNTVTNPVPSKDVSVTPASDTTTTITDGNGKVVGVDDVLTYTIHWKNAESTEATVNIKDKIPDGTEYVADSATVDTPSSGTVSDTAVTDTASPITWSFKASAGAEGTVSFKVKVTEAATQLDGRQIDNTATVQLNDGSEIETNPTHNPVPEKTVDVTNDNGTTSTTITDADGRTVGVGDVLTYKVYWANGESEKASVTVTDKVPTGTTLVNDSAKAYDEDGNEVTGVTASVASDGTITWALGEQEAGASGHAEFQVTVTSDVMKLATPQVDNTAHVQIGNNPSVSTNPVTNPTPDKDVSIDTGSIQIQDGNGQLVGVGDVLTYTVHWKNTATDDEGNLTEATVTITDKVPDGTTYKNSSASIPDPTSGSITDKSATQSGGTVTWTFKASAGAEGSVTFQATVDESAMKLDSKKVENTAYVQIGDDPAVATNPTENPVPSKTVTQTSGTTVIQDADGKLVGIGDTLTYRINWQNNESGTADITITDSVPKGTVYVEDSARGANATVTGPDSEGNIEWVVSGAQPGSSGYVLFQVTVDKSAIDLADNTIENESTVTIGNKPSVTNKVTNIVPEKEATSGSDDHDVDGTDTVTVGDEITYTIHYTNTESTASTVTVSDVVPTGTVYVGDSATTGTGITLDAPGDGETGTVKWTIASVDAGASGTVSFKVRVTEAAVTTNEVDNTATVQIGDDNPAVKTNTTTTSVKYGSLTISKKVEKADASLSPYDAAFTFKVTFKNAAGTEYTGAFDYAVTKADGSSDRTGSVASGGTLSLKDGQTATFSSLPDGASWTVEEQTLPAGFSIADADKTKSGSISSTTASSADFTNTYSATGVGSLKFQKQLTGRSWNDSDSFTFTLKPTGSNAATAPMPEGTTGTGAGRTVTTTATKPASGSIADFSFDITFDKAGTYTYQVTEEHSGEKIDGITYSNNTANVTVTLTDDGYGKLTAAYTYANSTFTNVYEPGTVNFDTDAGLQIVKNMSNSGIGAGQFSFTLIGDDDASTAKLTDGTNRTYTTTQQSATVDSSGNFSATEIVGALTGLRFTKDDVNKTYSYTITETIPDDATNNYDGTYTKDGVTYDGSSHTLTFDVSDHGLGVLAVLVTVDGDSSNAFTLLSSDTEPHEKVSVTFNNSYTASDTSATIDATKTLTGRKLQAGDFSFRIDNSKAPAGTEPVATATNAEDGSIDFGEIDYTFDQLLQDSINGLNIRTANANGSVTYTYTYTVSEDVPASGSGISQNDSSFTVTVRVTDDGKGSLSADVSYPSGSNGSLGFKNSYNTDTVPVEIKGSKQVTVPTGGSDPNIAGKFTFTLQPTGENAATAPMPAGTTGSGANRTCTTTNAADHTVTFGTITYTLENVFGDDSSTYTGSGLTRSKVFEYEVSESGTVANIENDTHTYAFTVTITDDGQGHLTAVKSIPSGELFTFTNAVTFEPVSSGFNAVKHLDVTSGVHTVKPGEFSFELRDARNAVVSTGTNAADGTVAMSEVTFNNPGEYSFTLREVKGTNGEMTYDDTVYQVVAYVTADSDNALSVRWQFSMILNNQSVTVAIPEFTNSFAHEPLPTSAALGASKQLKDGTISEGMFSFNLFEGSTATGDPLQTKSNAADGTIAFDQITYDTEGTYTYTIREVLPTDTDTATAGIQNNNITYDETVYHATVTVSPNPDNGDLQASVTYDNGTNAPTFVNTQVTPPENPIPENPTPSTYTPSGKGPAPKTGENMELLFASILGTLGLLVITVTVMRRRYGKRGD